MKGRMRAHLPLFSCPLTPPALDAYVLERCRFCRQVRVAIRDLTYQLGRSLEGLVSTVTDPFTDSVVRLGVTGLSRAGKTVFITGLVANLLDRGRMPQLRAEAARRIEAAYLQPQPDDTIPRFDFEGHLAALTGDDPHWPESTRAVSELRLSV